MKSRFESRNIVNGQLKLPTTGNSGGILIGGDVLLYRYSADTLGLPDNIRVEADKRVYFRDATIFIYSSVDTALDIQADGYVDISSPIVYIDEYLSHAGDTDTYMRYQANDITLYAGGFERIRINATGLGFFSKSPVTQAVHLADPTDLTTCIAAITQLIDNQKALGLMAADP